MNSVPQTEDVVLRKIVEEVMGKDSSGKRMESRKMSDVSKDKIN